jgi:nitrilase
MAASKGQRSDAMATSGKFRVAAVQMVSGGDVAGNLAQAEPLIAAAARERAQLIVLPEYFGVLGAQATDKLAVREEDGHGTQQDWLARQAREHRVFIVGGTVPIATADPGRVRSASLVYGPDGGRVARYDKIHLFAFTRGDERYDEGRTIEPGAAPVAFATPWGRVGMSVCYDLRFPELYRALGDVALILVPSAFTATTGAAHWHLLLRARAVENQCYVLAAAQGGEHPNRRRTYGHSVLIDPWGDIVAERSEGPGIVVGDVDAARIAEVRAQLPALSVRRYFPPPGAPGLPFALTGEK